MRHVASPHVSINLTEEYSCRIEACNSFKTPQHVPGTMILAATFGHDMRTVHFQQCTQNPDGIDVPCISRSVKVLRQVGVQRSTSLPNLYHRPLEARGSCHHVHCDGAGLQPALHMAIVSYIQAACVKARGAASPLYLWAVQR